jgi:hypothetical protein
MLFANEKSRKRFLFNLVLLALAYCYVFWYLDMYIHVILYVYCCKYCLSRYCKASHFFENYYVRGRGGGSAISSLCPGCPMGKGQPCVFPSPVLFDYLATGKIKCCGTRQKYWQ